jgi:hypothetical protein
MASSSNMSPEAKASFWRLNWLRRADNRSAQDKAVNTSINEARVNTHSYSPPVNNHHTSVRTVSETNRTTMNHYHSDDSSSIITGAAIGYIAASAFSSDSGSSDSGSSGGD